MLIKLGIFKLVGKDCGNLAIGLGNSSVLDLVTLAVAQAAQAWMKLESETKESHETS